MDLPPTIWCCQTDKLPHLLGQKLSRHQLQGRLRGDSVQVSNDCLSFAQFYMQRSITIIHFVYNESRQVSERMRVRSYLAVWDRSNLIILQPLVLQSECDGACKRGKWSSDDCIGRIFASHSGNLGLKLMDLLDTKEITPCFVTSLDQPRIQGEKKCNLCRKHENATDKAIISNLVECSLWHILGFFHGLTRTEHGTCSFILISKKLNLSDMLQK